MTCDGWLVSPTSTDTVAGGGQSVIGPDDAGALRLRFEERYAGWAETGGRRKRRCLSGRIDRQEDNRTHFSSLASRTCRHRLRYLRRV
jgi:hypothetical protein